MLLPTSSSSARALSLRGPASKQLHTAALPCGRVRPPTRRLEPSAAASLGSQQQPHERRRDIVASAAQLEAAPEAAAVKMSDIHMWNGKRLQTQVLPLAENTVSIRSLDWDRDRFDIEFGLEEGTTYNSFLIFGKDKTALVDASHEKFHDLYLATLEGELKKMGRAIDYIVVSHTEPDHSGLIPAVLDRYPEAIVCGSKVCLTFLQGLTHRPFTPQQVKGGDKIDLGGGHVLEFVMAPNLHWPDTMFSFDHATGVMYTCDAFGLHYCTEDAFDVDVKAMLPHYRFYFDCLMKPNAKSVTTALRKVKDLPYETIANGHGPILKFNVPELVGDYQNWASNIEKGKASVAVFYASDYGFSDRLSQTLARGITKAGVQTEMVDMLSADPQEVVAVAARNAGLIVMAPPNDSPEARTSLAALTSAVKKSTTVLLAESFGGRDEPVDTLKRSLTDVGATLLTAPLRVKELPAQALYQAFEEAGTDLAQALTCKDRLAELKSISSDKFKAIARISSGLYVVTAAHNNARSAMVASWVSQASFEPLGLTVAIAKDRAIESLMQVGDTFVLNALGEDDFSATMRHFLQRFTAGQDRFEGVDTFDAPGAPGLPVLGASIAYMRCKVVSRLETPDHWVTYAEVEGGDVLRPAARTAVHRRKIGNYY